MSDNASESEQQQQMEELFICADVWLEVFAFLCPFDVGLKMALISDRFDALVDEHFKLKKWSLGWLQIRRANDGNGAEIISKWYPESLGFGGEPLPIPQVPLPNKVTGFAGITISYVDQTVIEFLQRIRRLFDSSGTNVVIDTSDDQSRSWEIIWQKIWPFVNDNICRLLLDSSQFGRLRQFSPTVLLNYANLRSVWVFFLGQLGDDIDASFDQVAKWLCTPRRDGLPKMFRCHVFLLRMEGFRQSFVNASEPLKNILTGEQLTLRHRNSNCWLLVRCPIAREEEKWAKWEEEAIEWDWSHQWNRIAIDFNDSDIGDGMVDEKAGPSEPKKKTQCFIFKCTFVAEAMSPLWGQLPLSICFFLFSTFFLASSEFVRNAAEHKEGPLNKTALKEKAHELFMHGYTAYMRHAFPHDELMPLTCQGRKRGVTPSRGDVDDVLGNFSLTLVDTLDTLVVVGELEEFERAVRLVVDTVRFDSDLVVSVFETNIRMVGGLLSAHLLSLVLKQRDDATRFHWYSDQLLRMATELADRLMPAFNTSSGVPYSRVNLKRGLLPSLRRQQDTCTACGGTMILEWATLSRLTGNPVYEEKARKAMDFLWEQRHRGSDLMGTVLNVNSGDWIRRDAGIGAGIDSYYEYTLKAYILLGDEDFLYRFNKHYDSIMRYLNKGPLFVDVHMHKPQIASRSFMDALLAFWPGVQVLKGDLRSAIEMHQMLYTVVKRHKFLPDAFTHDLQVHWAQHPLRPEFIESTYFLYRATRDPHYLEVAKQVLESLEENVKVMCGFASIKDVRTMEHEDQMESFVLAETFKYLYMIFAEPDELPIHPDNYVLTTEAHFLPLTIGEINVGDENRLPRRMLIDPDEIVEHKWSDQPRRFASACPNLAAAEDDRHQHVLSHLLRSPDQLLSYGHRVRQAVSRVLGGVNLLMSEDEEGEEDGNGGDPMAGGGSCPSTTKAGTDRASAVERLQAWAFNPSNPEHLEELKRMGIQVELEQSGFVKMVHAAHTALNAKFAIDGLRFLREISAIIGEQRQQKLVQQNEGGKSVRFEIGLTRVVQLISWPHYGAPGFAAAPAHFGAEFGRDIQFTGELALADPLRACSALQNPREMRGRVAVVRRGACMFEEKARNVQSAGAIGVVVIDNQKGTSAENALLFAMSGASSTVDGTEQEALHIPAVFLFHAEGELLLDQMFAHPEAVVRLAGTPLNPAYCFEQTLRQNPSFLRQKFPIFNQFLAVDAQRVILRLHFYFGDVHSQSAPEQKQAVVERNVRWIERTVHIPTDAFGSGVAKSVSGESKRSFVFLGHVRALAYSLLGFPNTLTVSDMSELRQLVKHLRLRLKSEESDGEEEEGSPPQPMLRHNQSTSIICRFRADKDDNTCTPLATTRSLPVHT
uniref:alpha-1,2-Mannosidase n=1 Tax=Globodera rostochiensis TaxID=31243 RepID=A0A914HBZ6_GLORO